MKRVEDRGQTHENISYSNNIYSRWFSSKNLKSNDWPIELVEIQSS
jgi:hypothetical protein